MREMEDLLPTLVPPAGGLHRLQRSLAARTRPGRRWPLRLAWAATACLLVAFGAASIPGLIARQDQAAALATALARSVSPPLPAAGIEVVDGAAMELPSGQGNVKLYLVQTGARARQAKVVGCCVRP